MRMMMMMTTTTTKMMMMMMMMMTYLHCFSKPWLFFESQDEKYLLVWLGHT